MPSSDEQPPRRAHGTIDALPDEVQLQIKDWYLEHRTYQEIVDLLAEEGHQVSKSAVTRWFLRKRRELDRLETARERAQALAKHLVPDGTDIEGAAVALAGALCLEALADADVQAVRTIEDLAKVANSIGRIQSSAVARDKWEHEKRKRIKAAIEQAKAEMQQILVWHPELTSQLMAIVDQAEARMIEKAQ